MSNHYAALAMGLEALDHQLSLLDDLDRLRSNVGLESLGEGLEGIGGALKKVWAFILKVLASIRDAVKNLFTSKAARAKRQAAAIKAAEAAAKEKLGNDKIDETIRELTANFEAMAERTKAIMENSKGKPLDGLKTVEAVSKDLRREATDAVKTFRADLAKVKVNADNTVTIEGELSKPGDDTPPTQRKAKEFFTRSGDSASSFEVTCNTIEISTIEERLTMMALDKTFEKDVDTNDLIANIKRLEELTKKVDNANVEDQKSATTLRNVLLRAQQALAMVMQADKFQEKSVDAYIDFLRNLKKPGTGTESLDLDIGDWGRLF